MKQILSLIIFIISIAPLCSPQAKERKPEYGLRIQSYPAPTSEFTTILLDNGDPIDTHKKDLRLEMDIWAYPENALGSICRILSDNGSNVDLMYSVGENYVRYPMLVTGDKDIIQTSPIKYNEWAHIAITVSASTGKVSMDYNGEVSEAEYPAFKGTKSVRIAIGLCKLSDYLLFDVSSVAVKDVTIYSGSKKIRFWKMERHNGDVCYDEINNAPASVENANWIIDEAATWKKIYTVKFPYFPSIAFDPRVSTFYLAYLNDKSLYVYHATEGATDTIKTKGGEFAATYPNQLIYIRQHHQLLSYNLDEDIYSAFNPLKQSWDSNKKSTKEHGYWNNTIVYNPEDSSLISFGGYGYYHYNNTLLRSYPYSDKAQNAMALKDIHPRYSSSSVLVDSIMYIFGGRGCPSGRQELAPRNYYDMYAVNIHTNRVKKLWGNNTPPLGKGKDFVPGENMIYDKESNSMYIWGTLDGGTLFKADMETGQFEKMSLPMNASLKAQTLYCNLYYSASQKSFYSVMINSDVQGTSVVNIYQLDYPPVSVASLTQKAIPSKKDDSNNGLIITIIAITSVIIIAGLAVLKRKRKNAPKHLDSPGTEVSAPTEKNAQNQTVEIRHGQETQTAVATQPDTPDKPIEPTPAFYNLEKGCVRFLGGFRVFDSKGEDITPLFTPTLKQLLILLVLYTGKNPMGIPNNKLLSLLWSDKEEEAAKNNRNVYMSRLRNLLSQIGDVTIQTHNVFRNICFGNGTMCDYLEALRLFNDNDGENLDRLLELLFNGMMLPNVELDYVDSFKSSFSNNTLDLLSGLIQQPGLTNSLKLKIADTLFQHDYINEEALCVKCGILHSQGRTGMAQAVYTSFCKEYKSIIGSDYPHTLNDVISNNIRDKSGS